MKRSSAVLLLATLLFGSLSAAQNRSGYAEANGARLYWEEFGSGRPVVLIHGGTLDRTMWDDQAPELAKHYRVIRYDVRGFGKSSRNATQPYEAHEDLRALLEVLGIEKADLIGLSLGGRIAVDFALSYPDRVQSLVLAAPGLSGFPFDAAANPWVNDFVKAIQAKDTIAAADAWLRSEAMAPAMGRADLAPRVRALNYANSGVFALGASGERPLNPPALGRLHELKAPVLLLIGSRDSQSLRAISDTISARVPGLKRVEIPGAGHMLNLEKPAEFTRAVLDFLAAPPSRRP